MVEPKELSFKREYSILLERLLFQKIENLKSFYGQKILLKSPWE
ncbi:hypothetical protein LSS_17355 [Leptospira santarosai serovar Shermani str. LT 821]|uniref:Uncharacterized protein n=1 Tax=Leptospira santarosai serovar Shermani str. LT 821 TaxID=758847 RepID=K8XX54_9LEPT|nr:hypothetical protein LSS_17355 [Leptospira santarosai serovar Shermani str. LT 821]EPG81810.1 hypothetical protein LEP1GSC048_0639 [Leptospira santarosai serovar Shermani str. 1342KT]